MKEEDRPVLKGRLCYGHLGGTLGNRLFARLLKMGWIIRDEGSKTACSLTEEGKRALLEMDVDIYQRRRNR